MSARISNVTIPARMSAFRLNRGIASSVNALGQFGFRRGRLTDVGPARQGATRRVAVRLAVPWRPDRKRKTASPTRFKRTAGIDGPTVVEINNSRANEVRTQARAHASTRGSRLWV